MVVAGGNPSPYLLNLLRRKFLVLHPPSPEQQRTQHELHSFLGMERRGGSGPHSVSLSQDEDGLSHLLLVGGAPCWVQLSQAPGLAYV